jgi:hypothetical protein
MTIKSFGKKTSGRRLSYAARTAEDISVVKAVVLNRIPQGLRNRFLTCNFFKRLWTPLSGDDLVGHKSVP